MKFFIKRLPITKIQLPLKVGYNKLETKYASVTTLNNMKNLQYQLGAE